MKIAILGAGRLALALAQVLPERYRSLGLDSPQISGSTRGPQRVAEIQAAGISPVIASLEAPSSLGPLFAGAELLICLLAPGGAGGRGSDDSKLYENPFRAALQEFKAQAPAEARVIFASSTAVYDRELEPEPRELDESSPVCRETARGRKQLLGEDAVQEIMGESAQVLRLAGLYSSSRGPFRVLESRLASAQALPGDGGQSLNLIHEDDAASLLAEMVLRPELKMVLASDDGPGSRASLYGPFAAARGYPEPRFELGVSALRGKLLRPKHRPRPLIYPSLSEALRRGGL